MQPREEGAGTGERKEEGAESREEGGGWREEGAEGGGKEDRDLREEREGS